MEISLAQKAISLALAGNWQEAVSTNLQILKTSPKDTDSLNRLAKAHAELGEIKKAKAAAAKVIAIDPGNAIAQKCLEKWKSAKSISKNHLPSVFIDSFLEESGKTKLVTLLNPGDSKVFVNLDSGEEVKINSHAHKVSVVTQDDKYIGCLPDDLSARLRNLIKTGNKYQVLIKSVKPKEVVVFMREISKGRGTQNILSFPAEKMDYVSFTPPELVHKDTPEIEMTEEEQA
jgi:tetratricopeptide (TPR) repeat protein